jgi:sterol desaturase/sphingolipid hydroxylase (fatty acid hydroxylase superfamily)
MNPPAYFDLSCSVYLLLVFAVAGPPAMLSLAVLVRWAVSRGWLERTGGARPAKVDGKDLTFMASFVLVTGSVVIAVQYLLFRGRTFPVDLGVHPLEMLCFTTLLVLVVDTNGFFWHRFSHRNLRAYRTFHGGHHRSGEQVHVAMAFYSNTVWDYPLHSGLSLSLVVSLLPLVTGRYPVVTIMYAVNVYVVGVAAMHSGLRETPLVKWALRLICLPIRIFPTAIRIEDHQRHHALGNCNYGVFFSHWDRLLGSWLPAGAEGERESSAVSGSRSTTSRMMSS